MAPGRIKNDRITQTPFCRGVFREPKYFLLLVDFSSKITASFPLCLQNVMLPFRLSATYIERLILGIEKTCWKYRDVKL